MIVSGTIVAIAPNYEIFMLGGAMRRSRMTEGPFTGSQRARPSPMPRLIQTGNSDYRAADQPVDFRTRWPPRSQAPSSGADRRDGAVRQHRCARPELRNIHDRSRAVRRRYRRLLVDVDGDGDAPGAWCLVPEQHVPKALAIFNGGNALATVVAPPAGALLGATIGWRGAFFLRRPDRGHRFRLADDQHAVDAGRASARIRQHVQAVQQADRGSRPALPRDGHTRRCLDTAVRVGRHRYCRPHRYKPDRFLPQENTLSDSYPRFSSNIAAHSTQNNIQMILQLYKFGFISLRGWHYHLSEHQRALSMIMRPSGSEI